MTNEYNDKQPHITQHDEINQQLEQQYDQLRYGEDRNSGDWDAFEEERVSLKPTELPQFTTISEALSWVNSQVELDEHMGTKKVEVALEYLNNPHKNLNVIHITGTNGKGSTSAYLRSLLQDQGLRVGSFTSPHIMEFNERFWYNGLNISDEDLLWVINKMVYVNDYMDKTEYGRLTFFHLYTVMMAVYFNAKNPDVCIIEAGIGGTRDATNVFNGDVAVITTIGIDHVDKFGNSVEGIAHDKAGIIKQGAGVVVGNINDDLKKIIKDHANRNNATVYEYFTHYGILNTKNLYGDGSRFNFWQGNIDQFRISELPIKLQTQMLGAHQVENASVALEAFQLWMTRNQKQIQWEKVSQSVYQTQWMGRMEKVKDDPVIYIDGAHNLMGIKSLTKSIQEFFPQKEVSVLYAGLTNKDQTNQLQELLNSPISKLHLTTFNRDNAVTTDQFRDMMQHHHDDRVNVQDDWKSYVKQYVEESKGNESRILVVTGSLYFIRLVRQMILYGESK